MAGHSHAVNIKYKKNRKSVLKAKNFLKIRQQLKLIILEHGITDRALNIAQKNGFSKEKVFQIEMEIKREKK